MYIALILVLLAAGAGLLLRGLRSHNSGLRTAGILLVVATVAFFSLLDFWGEKLWFDAIGYEQRFWEVITTQVILAVLGAGTAAVTVALFTLGLPADRQLLRRVVLGVAAVVGLLWGSSHWSEALQFVHRVSAGVRDPILGQDVGFYLFTLPLLSSLERLLYAVVLMALGTNLSSAFTTNAGGALRWRQPSTGRTGIYATSAALAVLLAGSFLLDRYDLMYSTWGAVSGPGWTDVHIRMPMYVAMSVVAVLVAVSLALPRLRALTDRFPGRFARHEPARGLRPLLVLGGTTGVLWFLGLVALPGLLQWLLVEPNEITYEARYIRNNIEFTRRAFGLHDIEEREFPLDYEFSRETIERNPSLFRNVRLWDWRALDAVYKQFQEIRLYYEFRDVDIDRYTFGGDYRQVMISARELDIGNLPQQSQTFVNTRFKYTHGYGVTLTDVSEFTPQGLPNLLIKDIPPKSRYPELEVRRPQIYYGELTGDHVIANSSETEFDHPQGDENVYIHYDGSGGVPLSSLWRKFLFGFIFDGTRLFVSEYPTRSSRILFHRNVQERVETLAPFLHFDDDPYIVLVDGRLFWLIDAYTTSECYPYSETFESTETIETRDGQLSQRLLARQLGGLDGVNYIRNSVKVVVDAYNGDVDFYVFDEEDVLVRVWQEIFPELFRPRSEMPADLQKHVRYPVDMLLAQGLVYAKYHMTDPTVFYNQEDLWIRATEKYYSHVQPVEPYYVMWELPQSDEPEFVLMLPFAPKKRQVLIGWIAGMCDNENYGRFLAYKFPKEQRVLGPQQVETKIDQDRFLSGQLTLWDQRGSKVIRGNVLAIPIENTLLYVEPIYLQAETAAYPELRLVVVMHEDNMSYAETFDEALEGLFEESRASLDAGDSASAGAAGRTTEDWITAANEAFEDYLAATGDKDFEAASRALERLQQALTALKDTRPE